VLLKEPPRFGLRDELQAFAGVTAAVDRPTAPVAAGAALAGDEPLAARTQVKARALVVKIRDLRSTRTGDHAGQRCGRGAELPATNHSADVEIERVGAEKPVVCPRGGGVVWVARFVIAVLRSNVALTE